MSLFPRVGDADMPTRMQTAKRLRVFLLGAGSLGRAFLRRLGDGSCPVELVGVQTAHHGYRIDPEGIEPDLALSLAEAGELGQDGPEEFEEQLRVSRADALVECIPQNIRAGEPALSFHRQALDAGVHVITANKAPIALGYQDLKARAQANGVQLRFEATVLDGLPVFSFVQTLVEQRVLRVRGVLNATSSVVFDAVASGGSRSRGLARAQAQGIAEADPVLDLDGWDAAAKSALLANVWMGGQLRIIDVVRTGLETLKDMHIERAAAEGRRFRLVSTVECIDGHVRATVQPVALSSEDNFWMLQGPQGGLEIDTDAGHRFTLFQRGAGLSDAAGALLSDCYVLLNR